MLAPELRDAVAREVMRRAFQETERAIDAASAANMWPWERAMDAADGIIALLTAHRGEGEGIPELPNEPRADALRQGEAGGSGGWLPIETAPKDGTRVLLSWGTVWVGEGWFYEDDGRWFEQNTHPTDATDGEVYPDHWRPLPAAPNPSPISEEDQA